MTTTPRTTAATDPARPGARERNPRGQGGRLRDDILSAATDLLDESGTEESVTLRAVARRAGISAPAIYGHFADRQTILLAVVQGAFAELHERLRAAARAEDEGNEDDPVARLHRVCAAYLDFAATRPQRYRAMFGGLWNTQRALAEENVTAGDLTDLGQDALEVLATALQDCVAAGCSGSDDPRGDAVALWLGLHGLAHQRVVTAAFPWPADIVDRLVVPLAHLVPAADGGR
ncbi:TetR/AcrR family transcriptional regulator [Kineococcus sp. GCM10028916]|uniref:TetR/AcrR family transcriptional regulator n=1 Tax=Kineococcus sp. GCM10028916 TaxID=3273394 RepID=UPI00363646B2